ncbi:hypothetical protein [Diplocloster agilis]|uniref:Uncharacterized protein n=1 Tax=Diplocloster agilis TaxID=2850323 RepID=A0A949K4N9_9FIRM|nr:hypothetical protein [Diplocloster agilis]MBU9739467.1 hypothetical protein [Diplocloster agilis]
MNDTCHITFHETECILIEENGYIFILPKNPEEIKRIRPHFEDKDFLLKYKGTLGYNSIAFVERMSFEMNHSIKLFPKYIVNRCHKDSFIAFEMTGETVDDFFSPSRYFFDRNRTENKDVVDVIYNNELAESWEIIFEEKPVSITLSFGDILRWGIASDLMLHPKLTVSFEQTSDITYIYRLYRVLVRFLQIIRYDTKCGKLRVDLLTTEQGHKSYNGYLRDLSLDQEKFYRSNHEVEYGCYRPYIQQFLQFAAQNTDYTFFHYPSEGLRFRGRDYSAVDYMNIFAAFEAECHANKDLFEKAEATKVQTIKDAIISQIEALPTQSLKQEDISFIENAKQRILQLGTQLGQTKKIINAYHVLHNALDGSVEYIFYLSEFRLKGHIQDKDIKTIATFLAGQRGAVAHGGFSSMFTDVDAQKIHFLEILTYAQMLKRVGLEDLDIERVIGAVFCCNYVLSQEQRI